MAQPTKWSNEVFLKESRKFNRNVDIDMDMMFVIKWLQKYGNTIKKKRLSLGLSQSQVAKGINRSMSYLSHIEMGERFNLEDDCRLKEFFSKMK